MEIDSQMEHIAGAGGDIPDDLADGKNMQISWKLN